MVTCEDRRVLHIRVVTPPSLRPVLLDVLEADDAVHNIVVLPGAARRPDGDLVQFDVAREGANEVIASLRSMDLHRCGSIAIERIDTALSDVAAAAEAMSPGASSEAVIWEEVESKVRDESTLTGSFLVTMAIAVMIGAAGILLDSPVLIVGAMVVGPDYGPLAGVMLGLHRRRIDRTMRSLGTLVAGFGVGIAATAVMTLVVRGFDRIPEVYLDDQRPLTSFISRPDGWSVLVAVLAGTVGMLALTESKGGTLVGVLISVTTVPAASNIAVGAVMQRWGEAGGALVQLLVNIIVVCVVGLATLAVEQRLTGASLRGPRLSVLRPRNDDARARR
jgi:uncharacterized hydrophobic protein (TIGR00271 family)